MSKKYSHILLPIPPETFPFTTTIPGRGEFKIPLNINRKSHSEDLKLKLKRAWDELKKGTEEYNIMMRCYKQWPTSVGGYDHNMVLYCLNKQLTAYRELRQ